MKSLIALFCLCSSFIFASSYPHRVIGEGYNYFEDYLNTYYVETGTSGGSSLLRALEAGFQFVRSIDNDPVSWKIAKKQFLFRNSRKVKLWFGDSSECLSEMIQDINQPITFFLDAHRFPPVEDGKPNTCLLKELDQIAKHPIKEHTIIIDDIPCCGTAAFDYITKEELILKLLQINPSCQIHFISNHLDPEYLLVAEPPAERD